MTSPAKIQDLLIRAIPAYAHSYSSASDATEGWHAGHDFKIIDSDHRYFGAYVNKDDAEAFDEIRNVMIYYKPESSPIVIELRNK